MNITNKIRNNATPVGFAQPPTRPNSPGLVVNNHSEVVKLFLFITGLLTTTKAIQLLIIITFNCKNNLQKFKTCITECQKLYPKINQPAILWK